jgi:tetratricopeptide (TPR) repeat protein
VQRGVPAIRALLLLTGTLGRRDPRLRLQLAELAHDLAAARPAEADPAGAERRDQTAIELANAYRVVGRLGSAQELLGVVAERRARRRFDTPLDARWLEIQGMVINDQWRAGAAGTILAASSGILRRHARRTELAVSLLCRSSCSDHAEEHLDAVRHARNALRLLDPDDEPLLASMAWLDLALGLLRHGEPREALAILRQNREVLMRLGGARNAGRVRRIEGEALALLGDDDGASRAYDASVRQFAVIDSRYGMGLVTLRQAAALERLGDREQARRLALEAADRVLGTDPEGEIHVAMMLVRTTYRFTATAGTLPLDRVADFLDPAEFNPSVLLRTFLT